VKLIVEWFLAIVVAIAGVTNSPALEQWADEFNADCFTDTCVGCVDDCLDSPDQEPRGSIFFPHHRK